MKRFILLWGLLLVLFMASCGPRQNDQPYPTRPITYVVPWAPGGGTDASSRALASVLREQLGRSVNVVNRTGGGGVVGHLALANAAPNGYTIGAVTVEITMMHHMGLTDLTHESYTPLALLTNNPAAVTVRADAPWDTLDELLADVRANPGQYHASGTSRGGIWDLARIGMLREAELPETALPWVPSQGASPAFHELLAGGVAVVTAALAEAAALLEAGQVKVLGVMADERLQAFPNVPTLKEQGIDWSLGGWVGVGAPAGLSDEVRGRLLWAIEAAAQDPQYVQSLENAGFHLQFTPAGSFGEFMARQDSLNGALLRDAGIAAS